MGSAEPLVSGIVFTRGRVAPSHGNYPQHYQSLFSWIIKPQEDKYMVQWEHRYLLGTMVFTIAGDVVRDFDEEYEAWSWLEREGWGLVAIEPPDPVRPGACKYYFKRQRPPTAASRPPITAEQPVAKPASYERRGR